MEINYPKIGIAGAGTMGRGIAQVFAQNGHKVILYDLDKSLLEKALSTISSSIDIAVEKGKLGAKEAEKAKSSITPVNDLSLLKADIIIEAIVEDVVIKQKLFQELELLNNETAILATNTSSIPVTRIASVLRIPSRFLGIHFFNPAPVMKLVEIISGVATKPEIAREIEELLIKCGKHPVMASDSPGFIVNRVARQYYTESLRSVEEGAAQIEQVDRLLEATGFRLGPFRLMDLIGVDTNHQVTKTMFEQFFHEPRFRPSWLQQRYVDAGYHGKKTGKGFYEY